MAGKFSFLYCSTCWSIWYLVSMNWYRNGEVELATAHWAFASSIAAISCCLNRPAASGSSLRTSASFAGVLQRAERDAHHLGRLGVEVGLGAAQPLDRVGLLADQRQVLDEGAVDRRLQRPQDDRLALHEHALERLEDLEINVLGRAEVR